MSSQDRALPKTLSLKELLARKDELSFIVKALADTISAYAKTKVIPGVPVLEAQGDPSPIAVGGVIRFESSDFSIELFLGFSRHVFDLLYQNMFQMPAHEITPENHDLAGELLNIAFGAIDPKFRQKGIRMRSSLPLIYSGKELAGITSKLSETSLSIPYRAQGGEFVVKLYSIGSLAFEWKYTA